MSNNKTMNGEEYLQPETEGISVIIPCKDEETAIGDTVRAVFEALGGQPYEFEVIVVDDGSSDNSRQRALEAGARVLVQRINMGYGNAIMNGMEVSRYDLVAITDADGTYPIAMLPTLIQEAQGHDMVIGQRIWEGNNSSVTAKFFRVLLYYTIFYLTSIKAPDYNSGFRVFHKNNILGYRRILCPTFSFTTTITLLHLFLCKSVSFVPIQYYCRIGCSNVTYFRDALKTLQYVFCMTNLFQVYRLSLLLIALGVGLNLGIILLCVWTGLSGFVQIGLHLTTLLAFGVAVMAMNTNPSAYHYIDYLKRRNQK